MWCKPEWSARSPGFRYLILFCNCLLTFGGYFAFDLPAVLQSTFETEFGLTGLQYGLFYSLYAWANMGMVGFGGIITDKIGTARSTILFSTLVATGVVLFALGAQVQMYEVMVISRFLFGLGLGSLTVVQNTICSHWFKDKELAMAFGFTLTASRLGSVVNFMASASIAQGSGFTVALWVGAVLSLFSVAMAAVYSSLSKMASKQNAGPEREQGRTGKEKRHFNFRAIRMFPASFWLLSVICVLFYSAIFTFVAFASEFFEQKWSVTKVQAGFYTGTLYDISIVISPLLGYAVDVVGRRVLLCAFASLLALPTFFLFGLTQVHPVIGMVFLGFSYSLMAASLWPSVALVIDFEEVGTAYGVMTAIQMLGVALCNVLIGGIKDHTGYSLMMVFYAALGVSAFMVTLSLIAVDKSHGSLLAARSLRPCARGWCCGNEVSRVASRHARGTPSTRRELDEPEEFAEELNLERSRLLNDEWNV